MKPFEILEQSELARIHEAAVQTVERVGLKIDHPEALNRLADAGAVVDAANSRVRFPPQLVETALARAPQRFTCAGRTPEFDVDMAYDRWPSAMRTGGGPIEHFDPLTNQRRPLTRMDGVRYAHLADALPNVDIAVTLTPQDLPRATYDVQHFKDFLLHCRKHIWSLTIGADNLRCQLEMAALVAGGRRELAQRPLISGIVSLIDPFYLPADEVDRLLLYGDYGIPVHVTIVPMMGATAPYTVAGALVQATAEFLASLTMMQLLCPGLGVWYYLAPRAMDMRTGASLSASCPETVFFISAVAQLSRHYRVPAAINAGSTTCCQPHQAMFQYGNAIAMVMAAGTAEVGGLGSLNGGKSCSPDVMVLGDELIAYFKRLFGGYRIDDSTLAMEVLERVGPQGNFLADDHTHAHLRREIHFAPTLLRFGTYEEWAQNDFETIYARARRKRLDLQSTHRVPELDTGLQKELDRMVASFDRSVRRDGLGN